MATDPKFTRKKPLTKKEAERHELFIKTFIRLDGAIQEKLEDTRLGDHLTLELTVAQQAYQVLHQEFSANPMLHDFSLKRVVPQHNLQRLYYAHKIQMMSQFLLLPLRDLETLVKDAGFETPLHLKLFYFHSQEKVPVRRQEWFSSIYTG